LAIHPLNHFARLEKYVSDKSDAPKQQFVSLIRNEMRHETFMELAIWYHSLGLDEDAAEVLNLAPETPDELYWLAFLKRNSNDGIAFLQKAGAASPFLSFPFRTETAPVLEWAIQNSNSWKHKYYLGLLHWHLNNLDKARELFQQCGNEPDFAAFFAGRANLTDDTKGEQKIADLQRAIQMDKDQWRHHKLLTETYINQKKYDQALLVVEPFYRSHPNDYIMGMLYAKTLLLNKKFKESDALLTKLNIIPFEGATDGRELYREAKLMQAISEIQKKNYSNALKFINASKIWPVNLGAGKPYDDDIDMRLEDWMSLLVYEKTKKTDMVKATLEKINKVKNNNPQPLQLVTAWAMEKQDQKSEAIQWLDQLIQKHPENKMLLWVKSKFLKQPGDVLNKGEKNATVRLLEQLNQLH
jgi:tetratricopeptide (TPR) repeat protein